MMARQFAKLLLGTALGITLSSCVDDAPTEEPTSAHRVGLDETLSCAEGEVGWRFPTTPLDPNSEDYDRRAGDSAVVEINQRYAINVKSATCAGATTDEEKLLRNACGGDLSCQYQASCTGAFEVAYTCGAADTDDDGEQKVYSATASGGAVAMSCSQPASEEIEVATRTVCVPRQCHGRARRDLEMNCVEDPTITDVQVSGMFYKHLRHGRENSSTWTPAILPAYPPQSQRNQNVLDGRPIDFEPEYSMDYFGLGGFDAWALYPGMPYSIGAGVTFDYGLMPPISSAVVWMDDLFVNSTTSETVRGFRCVAYKRDIVPEQAETITEGIRKTMDISYKGVLDRNCETGLDRSEVDAAKKLGVSLETFRESFDYVKSKMHVSYDMEGRAALHRGGWSVEGTPAQTLAYKTPECAPNPPGFFYNPETGSEDLIGYYAQRELFSEEVDFADPSIKRRAYILPGDITVRQDLTIRTKGKFNGSLPIDLSWTAVNLNDENYFNPFVDGVDIGGAWQDSKSLPEANYAPKRMRASVFVFPYGRNELTTSLYNYKIGEILLDEPNPEGKTDSVNLPITPSIQAYFTKKSSLAYVADEARLFRVFYCIESDVEGGKEAYAFQPRKGTWHNYTTSGVRYDGELEQNYLIEPALGWDDSDPEAYATSYSLALDTDAAARVALQPFGQIMRGCRAATQPLKVTVDRFVSPLEPIASSGFTGSTKQSETGDAKMSGANDNDNEVACTGESKDNCTEVVNGGNRTDGEGGRSTYDLSVDLKRKAGDEVSASITAELLGYQVADPLSFEDSSTDYPSGNATESTPQTVVEVPLPGLEIDWGAIADQLDATTSGTPIEWDEGTYGGQMGLGVGWGFKFRWQLGPAPVLVTFTISVGASLGVAVELQFGAKDDEKYPCLGKTETCIEKAAQPATFRNAAQYCNVRGGRLAELSSEGEAVSVGSEVGSDEVWLGAQLAYRHPKPACAQNFNATDCVPNSETSYRWLSNSESFASSEGSGSASYDSANLFLASEAGLESRYPYDSGVLYSSDSGLRSASVNTLKPYICAFDPAQQEFYLSWSVALEMGAAAGFNLTGCTPSDNPGFCLGAGFNVVALQIAPTYANSYHWLFDSESALPFSRRGNTNISVPWALKLFEGSVTASFNFLFFSVPWVIASFDGITADEGFLYNADTPVIESLR